jgi:ABC-2 type transport system permease protein
MNLLLHELRLTLRSRLAASALLVLALLALTSVAAGMIEVTRQRTTIARVQPLQQQDVAAIAQWVTKSGDPGSAAYYTFHATWDAPSNLAFAALGMRDVAPYLLRVRALGLQAQLYEGETFNPELALPGRFDFSFVLLYLAPLFVIALFHDLKSGEREAGRLRMLQALPGGNRALWRRRVALKFTLLYAVLAIPFIVAATMSGAHATAILSVLLIIAAYLGFWIAVCALVTRFQWSSVTNAATLAACWLALTLVLPTLAHVAINSAIPVNQGVELTLAQREKVHGAWEVSRDETMSTFYARYPRWRDSAPLPADFHWKWYFAFHQLGDDSVSEQVAAYRQGLQTRDAWTARVGWLLPGVGAQWLMARLAATDLQAQLTYQDRVQDFHRRLREFYYGYLFYDRPFGKADFAATPKWE